MKFLYLLLGMIILGGGAFLAFKWWGVVLQFLAALLVCFLVVLGIAIIVLAIGEMISKKK